MAEKYEISRIEYRDGTPVLLVDGRPFIILSLQLDCDSCCTASTIDSLFGEAAKIGCNTVAPLLYWRLVEPEEGKFDFSILDAMMKSADKYGLRMVLVWFGSYKNGCLNYAPDWLRRNTSRFKRAVTADGTSLNNFLCYSSAEALKLDKRAVCQVFRHLAEYDEHRRVILFQVNNETGLLGTDRCYCSQCTEQFINGKYSDRYPGRAAEAFSVHRILDYMEHIAHAAKEIYPLPCYMNAWLPTQSPDAFPGTYPSGGPVPSVLDIYAERKQAVDFVSPDIYDTGKRNFCEKMEAYCFRGNVPYVAEHGTGAGSRAELNLYYAIGKFGAIGFDPWAIDCAYPSVEGTPLVDNRSLRWSEEAWELQASYLPLRDAMEPVAMNLGSANLGYWVQEDGDIEKTISLGDVRVHLQYVAPKHNSRGIAVRLSDTRVVVAGCGANVRLFGADGHPLALAEVSRGSFVHMDFVQERRCRREKEDPTLPFRMQDAGAYLVEIDRLNN